VLYIITSLKKIITIFHPIRGETKKKKLMNLQVEYQHFITLSIFHQDSFFQAYEN